MTPNEKGAPRRAMIERPYLLVVDEDERGRTALQESLEYWYDMTSAADAIDAFAALNRGGIDLALVDVRTPGPDGAHLVRTMKQRWPATVLVMIADSGSLVSAVQAIRDGAYDYVHKPFDLDEVSLVLARALAPIPATGGPRPIAPAEGLRQMSLQDAVRVARDRMSLEYLAALLREAGGNVGRAAKSARMGEEYLHRLLERHSLRASEFSRGRS